MFCRIIHGHILVTYSGRNMIWFSNWTGIFWHQVINLHFDYDDSFRNNSRLSDEVVILTPTESNTSTATALDSCGFCHVHKQDCQFEYLKDKRKRGTCVLHISSPCSFTLSHENSFSTTITFQSESDWQHWRVFRKRRLHSASSQREKGWIHFELRSKV